MDMNILTVGIKMVSDQGKMFVMRYGSSRSWTIPNVTLDCEKGEENDTTYLKSAFQLIPTGINLISMNKIIDCKDKESIKSDSRNINSYISITHHSVVFRARVEITGEHSLIDIPIKFDYAHWIPQETLISIPFTNRITQKLMDYDKAETPPPTPVVSVLSGIM